MQISGTLSQLFTQFWLDLQLVGKDQALEHFGSPFYNCFAIRNYVKAKGRWLPATGEPKPGYYVIFQQSHIARVTKVTAAWSAISPMIAILGYVVID